MRLADSQLIPTSAASFRTLRDGFLEFFRSKWQCFLQISHVLRSPFADHFPNSLDVYVQVVFIGKCSINFVWGFIWVVLFNNEHTLFTCKLTHFQNPYFKIFITMIMHKMIDVSLMRNEYLRICLLLWFLFHVSTANIFRVISVYFQPDFEQQRYLRNKTSLSSNNALLTLFLHLPLRYLAS